MSSARSMDDRPWYVAERWQQYEGEIRANQMRILAIGSCYLIHLWNYFSSQGRLPSWGFLQLAQEGQVDRRFHVLVTLIALMWCLTAVVLNFALRWRFFPPWLPVVSTLADVVCLSSILCISSGPRSPLVLGYLLIVVLAALRFSLPLVRVTTVAGMLGYVCVLGCAKWPATFGLSEEIQRRVPRYHQLMVLLGIGLCGIMVGQVVRRAKNLAKQYAQQASRPNGGEGT